MYSSVIPRYSRFFPLLVLSGLYSSNFPLSSSIIFSNTFLSTSDIFRSSACHMIVHCLPLIILFVIHLSWSLSLNPQSINVSDNRTEGLLVVSQIGPSLVSHNAWVYCVCSSIQIFCISLAPVLQSARQ